MGIAEAESGAIELMVLGNWEALAVICGGYARGGKQMDATFL